MPFSYSEIWATKEDLPFKKLQIPFDICKSFVYVFVYFLRKANWYNFYESLIYINR